MVETIPATHANAFDEKAFHEQALVGNSVASAKHKSAVDPMQLSWAQLRRFVMDSQSLKAREVMRPDGVGQTDSSSDRASIAAGETLNDPALISRIQTDSRRLQPGDLFLALEGERFDGHDFLAQAKAQGAIGAIAQRGLEHAGLAGFEVEDSTLALGEIAHAWRASFQLGLIAVTGSNGKTTVTQMIASILYAWRGDDALATEGNFNNAIGVPLTLLRLRAHHQCGVLELGMNHEGEIAQLARWVAPQVALVNNAQREHQEFMRSVQAVALENGHVLEALGPQGVAVFPMDDEFTSLWREMAGSARCCRFGRHPGAEVELLDSQWRGDHYALRVATPAGEVSLQLNMAGEHNVDNVLASVACAVSLGVPLAAIEKGIAHFKAVAGRGQIHALAYAAHPLTLVDDSYNANPDSVLAAIDLLKNLPKPRVLVLGDMGEVGERGEQYHDEVGQYARDCGIDVLLTLGDLSRSSARAFANAGEFNKSEPMAFESTESGFAQLLAALEAQLPHCASVLVKGSRFMRMERVVQHVMNNNATQKGLSCF
jgi:UDP-N-acetylmuramoyl-tripeptide--D-alanyl-D-alanine ligase